MNSNDIWKLKYKKYKLKYTELKNSIKMGGDSNKEIVDSNMIKIFLKTILFSSEIIDENYPLSTSSGHGGKKIKDIIPENISKITINKYPDSYVIFLVDESNINPIYNKVDQLKLIVNDKDQTQKLYRELGYAWNFI